MLLAMFPEYQEKVYEELKTVFPSKGSFNVSYSEVMELKYLDMVINESMRIISPVPLIGRQTSDVLKLSNGQIIPKNLTIMISIFHTHRRKDIWGPNAETFYPDHFLPSNMENIHPYAYLPFTKGVRNCIGKS